MLGRDVARTTGWGGVALALALAAVPAAAQGIAEVTLEAVVDAGEQVVHLAASGAAGDERLFIVTKDGRVRIWDGTALLATPFLDIDALVVEPAGSWDERGLLSIAFDPGYAVNGSFYVDYVDNAGDTVVARYQASADPDVADPSSAHTVLKVEQPASNHNGGQLQHGPDGYLYVGLGDGGGSCDSSGAGCNAQRTGSLLGSLLRIDPHGDDFPADGERNYAIPPGNPFAGDPSAAPEIWSYGLRNPWRFSFDRIRGDLWIGDVGQSGATRREEVNRQPAGSGGGENWGWPVAEGEQCPHPSCSTGACPTPLPACGALAYPYYAYTGGASCAITGGFVYWGTKIPGLTGRYVFGDYCSGELVALDVADAADAVAIGDAGGDLNSFGEGADGELYLATGSTVWKLVPLAPVIFYDGLERGDRSAWSATAP